MHCMLIRNKAIVSPPFTIIRQDCPSKWWSLNSSYNSYYPQQQEDRTDARKKGDVNPKFVEMTKFVKRGRKDVDLTGFSLLEWRSISFGSRGFSGEPLCTEAYRKGWRASILAHWEFTQCPLKTPFSNWINSKKDFVSRVGRNQSHKDIWCFDVKNKIMQNFRLNFKGNLYESPEKSKSNL